MTLVFLMRDWVKPVFAMVEFSYFIFNHGLMDIPCVGGNFTWPNNQDPRSWSRID
jgi:hypothetical protein